MEIRPICRSKKPICVCKCPCGKGKYRQPARPKSFAPCVTYSKPDCPIESATIYRKSYLPACTEKAVPRIPPVSLEIPKARFAQETINRMSYPGWCNVKPPPAIGPCCHLSAGDGPMAEITTTRHDYVPKPFIKAEPLKPCNNIFTTDSPLSSMTINRLSYQPVCTERAVPIIPPSSLVHADGPMSNITVQKISYQPCPLPCKPDMPWAKKTIYNSPSTPFAKDTIYKKSYQPSCIPRTEPIIPKTQDNPLTSGTCFENCTIYRKSYQPNPCPQIPQPIIPSNNLGLCKEKMACDTINRMSYRPNCGFRPPPPLIPCTHQLLGDGPMTEITTTRHDYVPKPIIKVQPIIPASTMCGSQEPLSNKTINRLSYIPNCNYEVPKPIRPMNNLDRADGKIESCTIQKLSYQPVGPVPKCDMPWAMKKAYEAPCSKMACETIYNMSYDCPGDYVGDGCCCRCEVEPPCIPQNCLKPILV